MKLFSMFIGLFLLAQSANSATPMGTYYQVNVTNPAALVAAIDEYSASPTGQKNPARVTLFQIISNGANPATHAISVSYDSAEDMDKSRTLNSGSEDLAKMQAAMVGVMTPVTESMYRSTGISAGSPEAITSSNPISRFILMNVKDPAKYADAWTKMMTARDSDLPSNISQIMGAGSGKTSHVVGIYANNMAELMAGMDANRDNPAWTEFLASVDGIRTIEEDSIVVRVKSWGS